MRQKFDLSENKMNLITTVWCSYLFHELIIKRYLEITIDPKTYHASLLLFPFILYWQLDNLYGVKWRYCAEIYNKHLVLKTKGNSTGSNYIKVRKDFLISTLCLDLYGMRLENDTMFKQVFEDNLKAANKTLRECSRFKAIYNKKSNNSIFGTNIEKLIEDCQKYLSIEVDNLNA